jgi:glycosyltransferase involved in cell wall biosynthesis
MPTVSIIIPAYNQSQYLGDAIRSALGQTRTDHEVIVVDDGSTDETTAVCRTFTDPRVHYVWQANRGLSAARNTGILQARGEFLSFLDSDDQFLPNKLNLLLSAFEQDGDLGLVAGQAVLIDRQGRRLGEVYDRSLPADPTDLLLGNPLHVGSVLLRRDWQARVGPFDESLRSYEDWDLWLRLALAGCPMGWVAKPVSLYRFHQDQMTRIGAQMTTATFAVLDKRFQDPAMPESWRVRHDEAYSRGFLRAAAQAYTGREFVQARECMRKALALDSRLGAHGAERLARLVAGWANHAKTGDPLAFMASVYDHLPQELGALRSRRRRELARQATQMAWAASRASDAAAARRLARQAIAYWPPAALDRGLLGLMIRGQRATGPAEPVVAAGPAPADHAPVRKLS